MKIGLFLIYMWFYLGCLIVGASQGLTIHTSQGGFKLQNFKGEAITNLTGSLLIHDFLGDIFWKGKWKKVYAKDGRSIYKGEGNVEIKGGAKVIQFLGRSVDSKIEGTAKITLYPSLIQDDKKSVYQYDNEKNSHQWGMFSLDTLWLPRRK